MKKIAFVIHHLCGGGAERFTANIANALCKEYKVYIVTGKIREDEYELCPQVERANFLRLDNFIIDTINIRRFCNKKQCDVLIGIDIYANRCVCLANFFLKPLTIISERNDPEHNRLSWKSKLFIKLLYWKADLFVFQTQEAKAFYSKSIQKRSKVIHNPVVAGLPERNRCTNKEIVTMGRLENQKDHVTLIKAFNRVAQKYPAYSLKIYGVGSYKKKLEGLVRELKLDKHVSFEGFSDSVHEEIKSAEIFVMSSKYEGMPNALIEAMAMGFPVISTDCPCGGPRELIHNGENGILIPVGDEIVLAEKIAFLIENKKFAEQMGKNAKKIKETHSIYYISKQWKKMFENIR